MQIVLESFKTQLIKCLDTEILYGFRLYEAQETKTLKM